MSLQLKFKLIPDPCGFNEALLLKGDWLIVGINDGMFTGLGEASHSGNDEQCMEKIQQLFECYVKNMVLNMDNIKKLEQDALCTTRDFLSATAISGINQALYELLAKRNGVSVWQFFTKKPVRDSLPLYTTINRALTTRTMTDYYEVTHLAKKQGFKSIKCAPFEKVTKYSNQLNACRYGLSVLKMLRAEFSDMEIRIDFHKRFTYENFIQILPEIENLAPYWIEEPCPIGENYKEIKSRTSVLVAGGELFFGTEKFEEIMVNRWADVVMPDVKHVGGFGPLIEVCKCASEHNVKVSPHNPSGPISTMASLQSAAVSACVESLEIPLLTDLSRFRAKDDIENGCLFLPDKPGWGINISI